MACHPLTDSFFSTVDHRTSTENLLEGLHWAGVLSAFCAVYIGLPSKRTKGANLSWAHPGARSVASLGAAVVMTSHGLPVMRVLMGSSGETILES